MFELFRHKTDRRSFLKTSGALLSVAEAGAGTPRPVMDSMPDLSESEPGSEPARASGHNPKWCLFFDFHTQPACPDVGATFDATAVTDFFEECGVDYVVFPARCNLGTAYYNTRVGIRHPSLKYDLYDRLAEACHAKGSGLD